MKVMTVTVAAKKTAPIVHLNPRPGMCPQVADEYWSRAGRRQTMQRDRRDLVVRFHAHPVPL